MIRVTIDGVTYSTDDEAQLRAWLAAGKPGKENLIWPEQVCFGSQFDLRNRGPVAK